MVAVVNEFKEKCKKPNKTVHFKDKDKNFLIHVHCLEENMDVKKEKRTFGKSVPKTRLPFAWNLEPLEETQIISIKKNYFSTYIFTFNKKEINGFFCL